MAANVTVPDKRQGKSKGQGKGKGVTPQWDETDKHVQTRRAVFGLIVAVVAVWVVLLYWLFALADVKEAVANRLQAGIDLTLVLAPVIAAAAGVERLLETIFNTIEGAWRTIVAYMGYGMRWLKSAETEVAEARNWLQNMGAIYNGTLATNNQQMAAIFNQHKQNMIAELRAAESTETNLQVKEFLQKSIKQMETLPAEMLATMTELLVTPVSLSLPNDLQTKIDGLRQTVLDGVKKLRDEADAKTKLAQDMLQDAQARLKAAEDKLAGATNSDDYKGAKGAASIILGLMLGVIVAAVGQLQMFALLGIDAVPAKFDVLITGLTIGSGSYPIHSLVGILQQGKDTLDSLKGFFNRSAPQATATEQRLTTTQAPSAPGGKPVVQQAVIATTTAQTTEDTPNP